MLFRLRHGSIRTERIYVGLTESIEDSLRDHNAGSVQSTKKDSPWEVIAQERAGRRKEAMALEWKIKRSRGTRLKWIENNQAEKRGSQRPVT